MSSPYDEAIDNAVDALDDAAFEHMGAQLSVEALQAMGSAFLSAFLKHWLRIWWCNQTNEAPPDGRRCREIHSYEPSLHDGCGWSRVVPDE